jgi:hypothetical protein
MTGCPELEDLFRRGDAEKDAERKEQENKVKT